SANCDMPQSAVFGRPGGGNLSGNQKESVKDLFRNTPAFSFIFHRFYTMATGIFSEKYMPDSLYYQYIDPYFNNWNMAKYLDHKGMYRNMFPGAKQPRLLAYRMNGFWYDENGKMIDIHKALAIIMKCKSCFIKQAVDSEGGHGVFFVNPKQHTIDSINDLLNQTTIDIVVQEGLVQSDTLSAINKNSVNTIRLLTLLRLDGTVKIYSVVLRMGIGDAKVDNASSGGITVGVEDNGRLKSCAYSAKGMRFDIHPTSNVKFDDFIIPNYEKVKQTVIEQAHNFPHFRLISWDIALDADDNPIIIEANLKYGEIDFHQLNNGPLFGDDTKEILDEVFSSRFKSC
uniref:sugar-transfer associated ATP-grasp domain-containing protein n=1 Tax=uncultured Prevotella sp. TaxID=159272 RepID=UPI0025935665